MAGYKLRVSIERTTQERLARFMEAQRRPESNAVDYLLNQALDAADDQGVLKRAHESRAKHAVAE